MTDFATDLLQNFHEEDIVNLTRELIAIPSPLWHETSVARWLADWLAKRGFEVEIQEIPLGNGRVTHQTIATLRGDGSGPSLMLCGHTDTSDWNGRPYREEEWRHDPFSGDVEEDMLYGLGAINMKGGLACVLLAADLVRRSGRTLKGDLIVACVAAETGGGVGAVHLIESGLRPHYCIVTEAGNLDVGVISTGYVQGKIRIKGEFKARVPYINPIERAARLIQAFGPSYHPLLAKAAGGWLEFTPHPLLPGFPRMAVRGIEHFQDVTTLMFDLRIIPGMDEAGVKADLVDFLENLRREDADFHYELVVPLGAKQPNMPAREATACEEPVVANLIHAHELVTGQMPQVGAGHRIGATADTCHFKGVGITCVEYGPGFIPTWPMVDECISVEQLVTATKVLALTAQSIVSARENL